MCEQKRKRRKARQGWLLRECGNMCVARAENRKLQKQKKQQQNNKTRKTKSMKNQENRWHCAEFVVVALVVALLSTLRYRLAIFVAHSLCTCLM